MIIHSKSQLKKIIESQKQQELSVLVKKGVFDIIHPGHVYAISLFKQEADIVVILIQSDSFTRKKKGPNRPINSQEQRMAVIDGIKGVDYVYADKSNSRDEYLRFLKYLKPTFIAITAGDAKKSKDYENENWRVIEFPDKKKKGFSTTEIINRILGKYTKNL